MEREIKDTMAWIEQFVDLRTPSVYRTNANLPIPLKPIYITTFSDNELVYELRNRGYEVKAIKTIEL